MAGKQAYVVITEEAKQTLGSFLDVIQVKYLEREGNVAVLDCADVDFAYPMTFMEVKSSKVPGKTLKLWLPAGDIRFAADYQQTGAIGFLRE